MEVVTRPSGNAALSGGRGSARSFDLNSWKGLTEVLKAARESGMDPDAYGDFRDKVLSYAQSGGDAELKQEIDAVLKTLKPGAPKQKASGEAERTKAEAPAKKKAVDTPAPTDTPEDAPAETAQVRVRNAETEMGETPSEKKPAFGHARRRPTFGPPVQSDMKDASAPQEAPAPSEPEAPAPKESPAPQAAPEEPQAPAGAPEAPKEAPAQGAPEPPEKAAAPKQEVQQSNVQTPSAEREPAVKAQAPAPQAEPMEAAPAQPSAAPAPEAGSAPTPQAAVAPAPAPAANTAPQSVNEYKQRITEIKRDVNARVGNPVTLIDAGNEVGREYMNALLRAMRATAGGQTGDLSSAMGELETAYRKIMEAAPGPADETGSEAAPAEQPAETNTQAQSAPAETPPSPDAGAAPKPEVSVPIDPEHRATPEKITVMPSAARQGQAAAPAEQSAPAESAPKPAPAREEAPEVQSQQPEPAAAPEPAPEKKPAQNTAGRTSIPSLADELFNDASEEANTQVGYAHAEKAAPEPARESAAPEPEPAEGPAGPSSEAGEPPAQPAEEEAVPQQQEAAPAPADELHTEEVNAGLEQLLNEWKLFKSSGFFGTGPGGTEHPLFKQLGPLSMSSIISGRFEKADKDVVQSIKDYANAWRHEQGVSYTPSETFEHYLRRVVQRILKRQRG